MITIGKTDMHGEVITWDVQSVHISVNDVREALKMAGLDVDNAPDLPVRSAFSRAKKELCVQNTAVDKLDSEDKKLAYQLSIRSENNGRVDYVYDKQLELDEEGKVVCMDDPLFEDEAQRAIQKALLMRTNNDITRIVQRLFAKNSDGLFPLNRKGVAYFVPHRFHEFVDQVEKFVNLCGGSIHRFPVPEGTEEGDKSVSASLALGFEKAASDIMGVIEEWDGDTKQASFERAQEHLNAIYIKTKGYEAIMDEHRANLEAKIKEVQQAAKDRAAKLLEEAQA